MIETLSQYVSEVNQSIVKLNLYNTTTTPWFRGHSSENWQLTPSINRYPHLAEFERDLNRDFKLLSKTLIIDNYPENEFEWLYFMQHYGLPTRLLDWTESSLVGLFFAVANHSNNEDAIVWILSPRRYNWLVLKNSNTIPTAGSPYLTDYILKPDAGPEPTRTVEAKYPLALRPTKNSKRILAQRGVFTIHGNQNISILDFVEDRNTKGIPVLEKLIISGKRKLAILQDLYQCGISPSVLFPELPGISEELIMKYNTFFKPTV